MDKNYNKSDKVESENIEFSKYEFEPEAVQEIAQVLCDIPHIGIKCEKRGGSD
jgi:hypothetical protein